MDLVAVLLGGERVEEQAAVGQGVDEVLVRQHGHPFDLERGTINSIIIIIIDFAGQRVVVVVLEEDG